MPTPDKDYKSLVVITPIGELGPFRADEILAQVKRGEILRTDRLRTTDGQIIGTVSDVESGRIRVVVAPSSGPRPVAPPQPKRGLSGVKTSSNSLPPKEQSQMGLLLVGGGLLMAAGIVMLVFMTGSGARQAKPKPLEVPPAPIATNGNHNIRLTLGEQKPGMALVLVSSDSALSGSLPVQVGLAGDVRGVTMQPADGKVMLTGGAPTGRIIVSTSESTRATISKVMVLPGNGYNATGSLELRVEPLPPKPMPPSIASETFSYASNEEFLAGFDSTGWASPWTRAMENAVTRSSPLIPTMDPKVKTPEGHVQIDGKTSGLWCMRRLSQRYTSGFVWVSFVVQGRRDQGEEFSIITFQDGEKSAGATCTLHNRARDSLWGFGSLLSGGAGGPELLQRGDISRVVRIVLRIELDEQASMSFWIDPSGDHEPESMPGQKVTGLPTISISRVALFVTKNSLLRIADLRLGRSWAEVMPQR